MFAKVIALTIKRLRAGTLSAHSGVVLVLAAFAYGTICQHRWLAFVVAVATALITVLWGVESLLIRVAADEASVFAELSQRKEQTDIVLASWDREPYEAEEDALAREPMPRLALGLGWSELASSGSAESLFACQDTLAAGENACWHGHN
jgi:hypothetical protein